VKKKGLGWGQPTYRIALRVAYRIASHRIACRDRVACRAIKGARLFPVHVKNAWLSTYRRIELPYL